MKMITAFLLATALALSCAHAIPIVKDCGAETVASLIDDVNTALSTGAYVDELAKLVAKFGDCAITAAVRQVAEGVGLKAQVDDLEALKVARAKAWLATRGG